ncbi:MAG: DUF2281 domain-containing protein [Steroidobacteraceae bacterium]|nr:DUF2281 domain-containing protein [Deltaproteobacteria bacterium]
MAKAIEIDRLPESARNELYDFYEFLVKKYAPVLSKSRSDREAKEHFFRNVTSHAFSLPADYTFDRNELHER